MELSCRLIFVLNYCSVSAIFWGKSGITYQLYTRSNRVNGQPLTYGNLNSVAYSNFGNNKPTR